MSEDNGGGGGGRGKRGRALSVVGGRPAPLLGPKLCWRRMSGRGSKSCRIGVGALWIGACRYVLRGARSERLMRRSTSRRRGGRAQIFGALAPVAMRERREGCRARVGGLSEEFGLGWR